MEKEKINWKEYGKELRASLSNERIWALGCCMDAENPHIQNMEDIEDELRDLENSDYDEIIYKHRDNPEYFDDFLIDNVNKLLNDTK